MKKYEILKSKAYDNISSYKEIAIELNDYLADNPEISGEEYKSSKRIVDILTGHGYHVEYPFAGYETAFTGYYVKRVGVKVESKRGYAAT